MLLMPRRLFAGEEWKALLIDGSPIEGIALASQILLYSAGF